MVLRAEKKLVNEVSLEEPIGKDTEGNEILLIDILYNDEENVFNDAMDKINGKKLRGAINECLTTRERDIISAAFLTRLLIFFGEKFFSGFIQTSYSTIFSYILILSGVAVATDKEYVLPPTDLS